MDFLSPVQLDLITNLKFPSFAIKIRMHTRQMLHFFISLVDSVSEVKPKTTVQLDLVPHVLIAVFQYH